MELEEVLGVVFMLQELVESIEPTRSAENASQADRLIR